MELREQEHNYEIVETEDGFEIIPIEKHRDPVRARLLQNGFWTIKSNQIDKGNANSIFSSERRSRNIIHSYIPGDYIHDEIYPLFSFSPLLNKMVSLLYISWDKIDKLVELEKKFHETPNFGNVGENTYNLVAKSQIIHKWAIKTTVKTLAKKASVMAKNKHSILDPDVVKLHRLFYSEAGGGGYWCNIYDVLKDREANEYLIKDLINFKSARCLLLTEGYVGSEWKKETIDFDWINFDWKRELGDMKNPYFRKTISNFPSGLPYYKIGIFRNSHADYIEEAITSRTRMIAYDVLLNSHASNCRNYYKVIKNSTDEEIKKAIKMYFVERGEKCDLRRLEPTRWAMHYMFDYRQKSENVANINMIGLYKRAKKYHGELDMEQRQREIEWEVKNEEFLKKEVALPPVELPKDPHLHFLKTVKDIHNEGSKMHHCVSGYANYAVNGTSFLFHIDYDDDVATAEVNRFGSVVQVRGPYNKENSATKYGEKILREWGKKFTNAAKMVVDFVPPVYEYAFDDDIPF